MKIERVPLAVLSPWDTNPRVGAVEVIAESLQAHGQYRPLVVQASTMKVLAGNHTLQAMQSLEWKECDIVLVDVDDEEAARIVLVDNRSSDLGTYRADLLAEVLASLPTIEGTGFDRETADLIISAQPEPISEALLADALSPPPVTWGRQSDDVPTESESTTSPRPIDVVDVAPEQVAEELQRMETATWPGTGLLEIPKVGSRSRVKFTGTEIIEWRGKDVGADTYLLRWRSQRTLDLRWGDTLVALWGEPHYLEEWTHPATPTARLLELRPLGVIGPSPGLTASPYPAKVWKLYRSRWLTRYLEEAGLWVIPDVTCPDPEYLEWALEGVQRYATVAWRVNEGSVEAFQRLVTEWTPPTVVLDPTEMSDQEAEEIGEFIREIPRVVWIVGKDG